MNIENPYQAPSANLDGEASQAGRNEKAGSPRVWLIMFGLNLVLPLSLATLMVHGSAIIGVWVGVLSLGFLGWRHCHLYPKFCRAFTIGTLLTALSQVFPVLHIASGMISISIVCGPSAFGPSADIPDLVSFPRALLVTWITGAVIGLASLTMAVMVYGLFPRRTRI